MKALWSSPHPVSVLTVIPAHCVPGNGETRIFYRCFLKARRLCSGNIFIKWLKREKFQFLGDDKLSFVKNKLKCSTIMVQAETWCCRNTVHLFCGGKQRPYLNRNTGYSKFPIFSLLYPEKHGDSTSIMSRPLQVSSESFPIHLSPVTLSFDAIYHQTRKHRSEPQNLANKQEVVLYLWFKWEQKAGFRIRIKTIQRPTQGRWKWRAKNVVKVR